MEYKVKFSGEFAASLIPMSEEDIDKAKQTLMLMNPILHAHGAKLEIVPVDKLFIIRYTKKDLFETNEQAKDAQAAVKKWAARPESNCHQFQEIEEVR